MITLKLTGNSVQQVTMKNGTRWSTSRAFLHPIRFRRNLHVKKMSHVTKILIDPRTRTAAGVEFVRNKRRYVVKARKEVIVCAGAINSPQLLMLSGIGPKEHLAELRIPVLQNSKVGYNLQDHVALGALTFILNDTVSFKAERVLQDASVLSDYAKYHSGWPSIPGGTEALGFYDLKDPNNPDGYPDLELLFVAGSLNAEPTLKKNFGITDNMYNSMFGNNEDADTYMVMPMVLRPKSRGRITLKTSNPFSSPLIDMGYFSDPRDLEILVEGAKKTIQLSKTESMQRYGAQLLSNPIPACRSFPFGSDDYWRCHARQITFTIYHQSGTCKMGPTNDPSSVVDPRLRVIGIRGLRVVDASIIPKIPAAHTNAPTIMIAEKASDMIKQDWGIQI